MASELPEQQPSGFGPSGFGVGPTLKAARERMGKDLGDCAEQLRIRRPFLEALEDSRHKDLPGGTYAVGFLRTYAEFLGLDGEEMVRRFRAEGAGDFSGRAELLFPSPVTEGRIPGGAVIFLGLLLAAVAYGGWYFVSGRETKVAEPVPGIPDRLSNLLSRPATVTGEAKPGDAAPPAAPAEPKPAEEPAAKLKDEVIPPAEVEEDKARPVAAVPSNPPNEQAVAPGPVAAPSPPPPSLPTSPTPAPAAEKPVAEKPVTEKPVSAPAPVATAPTAAPAEEKVLGAEHADSRILLKAAADDCWVQVRELDGSLLLSRLLRKGEGYKVPNRSGLTLMVGNAGALDISVDGRKAPSLGPAGQVKRDIRLDPDKLLAGG